MTAPRRIRVALVEPDSHYRLFLTSRLLASPRHQLLDTAGSAAEMLTAALPTTPDIVLIETALPDLAGADLIQRLRSRLPSALFIVLARAKTDGSIAEAIQAGASGYVIKSDGFAAIIRAIDEALSRSVARDVLRILRHSTPPFFGGQDAEACRDSAPS